MERHTKVPTPDFGLLAKLSDGKCNNSTLMNSCFKAMHNFLYYHGVAEQIRWVPELIDAISGEFEMGRWTEGRLWHVIPSGAEQK